MSDINKADIKLLQSQRLDDTDQGGGQMTSLEVVDGEVNNLFPDISRLDRVYGRVSMRKAYLAVQTKDRSTYYGSHTILTEQAKDANVSVCFFSSKDWFDTRENARDRIEAYLVKGPNANLKFWGNHYAGTSFLKLITIEGWPLPEVGDVLVIGTNGGDQYVRITDISSSIEEFVGGDVTNPTFFRNVIDIKIGTQLAFDVSGETDIVYSWNDIESALVSTTVAADASRYYGVAHLQEDVTAGALSLRVDDIQQNLVPSAASETAITDAGVGGAVTPLLQTNEETVSRSLSYSITSASKLMIGEAVVPASLSWVGGISFTDNGQGDILQSSTIIGTIDYTTGIITFGTPGGPFSGTGTATYIPAAPKNGVSQTGGIGIETNNRGFVYTFNCYPPPKPNTLKIDYLAGGKWYSIWDIGNGQLKNTMDDSIGSGTLNYVTGSLSITLGSMPDVDSTILMFWAPPAEEFDLSGETLPLRYTFNTQNEGINRNTFVLTYDGDGNGTGPDGEYGIMDDGNTGLYVATHDGSNWDITGDWCGTIRYALGRIDWHVGTTQAVTPNFAELFHIFYTYGDKIVEVFPAPTRNGSHQLDVALAQTPVIEGTLELHWGVEVIECTKDTTNTHTYNTPDFDYASRSCEGLGLINFNRVDDGAGVVAGGTIDYASGQVLFNPDQSVQAPRAQLEWQDSENSGWDTVWTNPGAISTYSSTRTFTQTTRDAVYGEFPLNGVLTCSYCSTDGTDTDLYDIAINPVFYVQEGTDSSGVDLIPGGLHLTDGAGTHLLDGTDGKLYTNTNGVTGERVPVGTINYANKTFEITSLNVNISSFEVTHAVGASLIDPVYTITFRTPGSPIRPGSLQIRGTDSSGTVIQATSDFSGDVQDEGIIGHVDFSTGLCIMGFGEWVTDDVDSQARTWYNVDNLDGSGNVWRPFSVRTSTILINCVITSYLPLDAELLGLDPVRLPLDGKVPIFRDGYIIVLHNSTKTNTDHPLQSSETVLTSDITTAPTREDANLIEVYSLPTQYQIDEGTQTCANLVPELRWNAAAWVPNYTVDLSTGEVTFLIGFEQPTDERFASDAWVSGSDYVLTGIVKPTSPSTLFAYECVIAGTCSGTEPAWPTSVGALVVDGGVTWKCVLPANQLMILNRIEDMCLASDVQVTGHIAITSPLLHDYEVGDDTLVSSVLPSADLQSRAYNEFEQSSWLGDWLDDRDGAEPLASYNFVDYPITVTNMPSVKERWLVKFINSTQVDVVGENFGVLLIDQGVIGLSADGSGLPAWDGSSSGVYSYNNSPCLIVANRNFAGEPYDGAYWIINCNGFGSGWASGNCIRFNQDAANYPLWFVRTTLQAPPEEPVDHYTIQIRGDSS